MTLDQINDKLQEARATFPCDTDHVSLYIDGEEYPIETIEFNHTDDSVVIIAKGASRVIEELQDDINDLNSESWNLQYKIDRLEDYIQEIKDFADSTNDIDHTLFELIHKEI